MEGLLSTGPAPSGLNGRKIHIYVCMYVCVYIYKYMYVCMYMYVFIYIYFVLYFTYLPQAYDSVDRVKMFNTLEKLGLGPKFIRTVKAMYSGDSIVNEQHGEKTRPLYLGRGLRQVGSFCLLES